MSAFIHVGSPSRTAPPSLSHRDKAAAPDLASPAVSSVKGNLTRPDSFLCLCRNRAICPRSAAVSHNFPTEPAVSKISRCSDVGKAVPLHDDRRPKTAQNLLFFGSKDLAAGPVQFVNVHGIVISIREAALVIRQRDEAVLQVLIFSAFVSVSRTLDEFAVLGCFRAILLGFEHAEPFRFEVSAYLNARMRGTISPVDPKGTTDRPSSGRCIALAEEMLVNFYGVAKDHCLVHRLRTPNSRRHFASCIQGGRRPNVQFVS